MKYITLIFAISLVVLSCKNEANDANADILRLEQTLESTPNTQNATALIQQYVIQSERVQNDNEKEELLEKAAQVGIQHKVYGSAMGILQKLLLDYPQDGKAINRLLKISAIFKDLRRSDANAILLRTLAEKYPENSQVNQYLNDLNVPLQSSDSLLTVLGTKMFNDSLLQLNQPVARQYVDACEAFAMVNIGDPQSAEYLHKGAETARSLQTIDKALFLYDWIIKKYPSHPRASQSLFLKAFTLDNNLKQYDQARTYYNEFLEKYPENDFAPSAQFLLENLGKSDEELLEALKEKGGQEN